MRLNEFEMLPELAFRPRFGRFGGMTLEGGKGGGSAPAPDPSIAAAANQAMQIGNQSWNQYQNQTAPQLATAAANQATNNNNYAANMNNVASNEANIATQQQGIYNNMAVPAMQAIQNDANNYNNAGYQENIASAALGDVNQQYAQQLQNDQMRQQAYGINPNSGAAQMTGNANAIQQAAAGAAASTQARSAAVALGLQKQQNVVSMANPSLANAQTAIQNGGTAAGNAVTAQQNNITNLQGNAQAANNAAAAATGATQAGGNIANQSYQSQISAFNAQQQANATTSAGLFGAIGTAAGMIYGGPAGAVAGGTAGKAVGSDIRLKNNIEFIEFRPDGLGVYEFEYKPEFKDSIMAGHGRFRGFMAHEVEQIYPDAVFTTNSGYKAVNYAKVANHAN